jgi:hypothetical protein
MAVNFLRSVDKTHFIGNDEPTDGRVQLGSLWSDADAGELYICTSISPVTFTLLTGGTGAPTGASYVVIGLNGTLSAERVLTAGTGISMVDGGANGNITISATGGSAEDATLLALLGV